jgi:hypothetical protein
MRLLHLLTAALLLSSPVALAQDDDAEDDYEDEDAEDDYEDEDEDEEVATAPPSPRAEWDKKPFAKPLVGASLYSDGVDTFTTVALGGQAGLHFWQKQPDPKIVGTGRVQAQGLLGGNGLNGYDVRLGAFAGPWYKVVGARIGPDFFYNQFTYGPYTLGASPGVAIPAIALLDFKVINFHAGFEPAFFFSPNRATVDWSQEDIFGFGGEFTYLAGVGLALDAFGVSVNYTDRVTAFGRQKGYGIGLRLGG